MFALGSITVIIFFGNFLGSGERILRPNIPFESASEVCSCKLRKKYVEKTFENHVNLSTMQDLEK